MLDRVFHKMLGTHLFVICLILGSQLFIQHHGAKEALSQHAHQQDKQVFTAHSTRQPCGNPCASLCRPTYALLVGSHHSHSLPAAFVPAELVASAAHAYTIMSYRVKQPLNGLNFGHIPHHPSQPPCSYQCTIS